jgi:glycosyltransferase involved in cell wall biosynthesis
MATLSIVVCSYNQARFITKTLDSLMNQRGLRPGELEVIVIDGASNDGSVEIIKHYQDRLAYFVSEPDRGQTHALNKGFTKASGDLLGWLCSDDLLEPDAVRFVIDYFERHPQDQFVYGDARVIDAADNLLWVKKEIPFNWFIWTHDYNYIPQSSAFWRRGLHEAVNGLDENFKLAMDGDLWGRFAERTSPRHLRKILSSARWYPANKTRRMRAQSIADQQEIARRYGVDHRQAKTRALAAFAKLCRISWKTATGCYW